MSKQKWAYSEEVKKHFTSPRNILEDEESYNEDGKGYVGNPTCGDMMLVVIKVDEDSQRITDCKWKTYGCASAVASTSVMSEMVTENGGMKLKDAFNLTPQKIMARLGGLPKQKIHCSVLGDKALREAINDYYKRSGQDDMVVKEEVNVVCDCLGVTDKEVEEAVLEGADTFEKLQEYTKVSTACGKCESNVRDLLEGIKNKYFNN